MNSIKFLDANQCEALCGGKYWGGLTSIKTIELGAVINKVDQSNKVYNTAGGFSGWGYGKYGSSLGSSILNSQANAAELVTVML